MAAVVLGSPAPLELLLISGRAVVEQDRLVAADENCLRVNAVRQHGLLMTRAGLVAM